MTRGGHPFTQEEFENTQVLKDDSAGPERVAPRSFSMRFVRLAARLRSILTSANGRRHYYLASYRVSRFLDSLSAEFGVHGPWNSSAADLHDFSETPKITREPELPPDIQAAAGLRGWVMG